LFTLCTVLRCNALYAFLYLRKAITVHAELTAAAVQNTKWSDESAVCEGRL